MTEVEKRLKKEIEMCQDFESYNDEVLKYHDVMICERDSCETGLKRALEIVKEYGIDSRSDSVDFKTTRKDRYLLGCLYAISKLLDEGSVKFATQVDGKWESIPWKEICEWIDSQMEGE